MYGISNFSVPDLYLNSSEIEHNKVLLALLHHIISKVQEEGKTFIDGFSYGTERMGLAAAFSACSFGKRYVVIGHRDDLHTMRRYQSGLKRASVAGASGVCAEAVFTEIEKIRAKVSNFNEAEFNSWIEEKKPILTKNDKNALASSKKIAEFFSLKVLMPEYWDDGNRIIKKDNKGKKRYTKDYDWSYSALEPHIRNLKKITIDDFMEYADALQGVEFMDTLTLNGRGAERESRAIWAQKPVLYLDLPKYRKENERYQFSGDETLQWLKFIGDFYLKDGMYFVLTHQEYRDTDSLYEKCKNIYYDNPELDELLGLDEKNRIRKATGEDDATDRLMQPDIMRNIKSWAKETPIYKITYRTTKKYSNTICFYTNIPVDEIDKEGFAKQYMGKDKMSGKFAVTKILT